MKTQALLEEYEQEGYVIFERLIQGQRLVRFLRMCEELVKQAAQRPPDDHWVFDKRVDTDLDTKRLYKVEGVGVVEPRFLDLVREQVIVQHVEFLLGPNLEAFGTRFFPAYPGARALAPWHQDSVFLEIDSDRVVSCLVYLEDACPKNGCLRVVPGSHNNGTYAHRKSPDGQARVEVDEAQARAIEIPAGSVVLLSPRLLYTTGENESEASRYTAAWHYVPSALDLPQYPRGFFRDRHYVQGI